MTSTELQALMRIRRSMGDYGQHVVLTGSQWDELKADLKPGVFTIMTMRDESERSLTLHTCNGPTHVTNLGHAEMARGLDAAR